MAEKTDYVGAIKTYDGLIADLKEQIAKYESGRKSSLEALRQELEDGATTGDRLRDLVVKAGGSPFDPAIETLRALEDRLAGKKGEFVVIGYPAKIRQRFGGTIRDGDFENQQHFRIGLLTDDKLRLGKERLYGALTLPVDTYLQGVWPESFLYKVVAKDKPIKGDIFEWLSDDQPPSLVGYLTEEQCKDDLLIGDEEVKKALASVECESFFAWAAGQLGRLVLEPT